MKEAFLPLARVQLAKLAAMPKTRMYAGLLTASIGVNVFVIVMQPAESSPPAMPPQELGLNRACLGGITNPSARIDNGQLIALQQIPLGDNPSVVNLLGTTSYCRVANGTHTVDGQEIAVFRYAFPLDQGTAIAILYNPENRFVGFQQLDFFEMQPELMNAQHQQVPRSQASLSNVNVFQYRPEERPLTNWLHQQYETYKNQDVRQCN